MTENPIQQLIDAALVRLTVLDREVTALQRNREIVAAQIEAYEAAREAVKASIPQVSKLVRRSDSQVVTVRRRFRISGGSDHWTRIIQHMSARYEGDVGYEEIMNSAEALGVSVNRDSLRTRMMNFITEGVFERVGVGRFKLTPKGCEKFKIEGGPLSNENGATEAAPDADEVDASSDKPELDLNV